MSEADRSQTWPLLIGVLTYVWWGLSGIYWNFLNYVDPISLIAHRALWGLPILFVLIWWRGTLGQTLYILRYWRQAGVLMLTACLISFNWGLFVYSAGHGFLIQAALGYFMLPLVNVALGMIFLGERPDRMEWLAIVFAAAGVLNAIFVAGGISFIATGVALSFGFYSLLRKVMTTGAVDGMFLETLILAPVACAWLILFDSGFGQASIAYDILLVLAGAVTIVPLVGYVAASRVLSLFTVGLLFYINPLLQFLIGWLVYDEPLTLQDMITFGLVWLGLCLYTVGRYSAGRAEKKTDQLSVN